MLSTLGMRGSMFDSRVFEVALGLTATFAFLSLITSHVVEILANLLCARARLLEKAIISLVGDANAKTIMSSTLLDVLRVNKRAIPSYIPANVFSAVLLQSAQVASAAPIAPTWQSILKDLPPDVQDRLSKVVGPAAVSLEDARQKIENWYDSTMERVSAQYRRYSQFVAFFVACALVGISNVDAVSLARALWASPASRVAGITLAQKQLEQCKTDGGQTTCPSLNNLAQLEEKLPLGWSAQIWAEASVGFWPFLTKFYGLLLSVMAISLGAPFWFDLLKRVSLIKNS